MGSITTRNGSNLKRTTLKLKNIPIDLIFAVVLIMNNLENQTFKESIHITDKK